MLTIEELEESIDEGKYVLYSNEGIITIGVPGGRGSGGNEDFLLGFILEWELFINSYVVWIDSELLVTDEEINYFRIIYDDEFYNRIFEYARVDREAQIVRD